MAKIDRKSTILLEKPTVITRAIFWRVPHNSQVEDVCLKLGRYKKPRNFISIHEEEELESLEPKSELTLTHEELKSLVDFLQKNYEPFSKGVKAFIPLDHPFDLENANQIKALFSLPNKVEVIKFIIDNNIISNELVLGLRLSQRLKAIK